MLLHEEQTESEYAQSSRRVTPQELAEAVAALEARKEAERARQAETISIGDALDHLGLNTPEEEVLSEVESLRKKRAQKSQQEQITRATRRLVFGMFVTCTVLIIIALGLINLRLSHRLKNATLSFTPLPTMLLSQIPDGRIAHCDSATLGQLAGGLVTPDKVSVDTRPFTSHVAADQQFVNEWTITKKNGQLLVTGWASADQALAIQNDQQSFLYSSHPQWLPPANIVPVQIPAYRFVSSVQMNYLATGAATKEGSGVVQSLSVLPTNSALAMLVKQHIDAAENLRHKEGQPDDAYFTRYVVKSDGLHLEEDSVGDPDYKQRATQLAEAALQSVNTRMPVINDMKVNSSKTP